MDESTVNGRPPENRLIGERREKLRRLREVGEAYPNDFRRDALADALRAKFSGHTGESLDEEAVRVSVAGRMMSKRVMGKASFCHLQDQSGQIQLFIKRDRVSPEIYQAFKSWHVGDIVGAAGNLFKTSTGELSVRVGRSSAAGEVASAPAGEMARYRRPRTQAAPPLRGPADEQENPSRV